MFLSLRAILVSTSRAPRGRSGKSGTAALEFALVAPMFIMLVIGIATFGLYFGTLLALTSAASEGARASVAGLTQSERNSLGTSAASTAFTAYAPYLSQTPVQITATQDPANTNRTVVTVSYNFGSFGTAIGMGGIVPVSLQTPTVTMSVANAGYY
jgi:Flp pilus assembly protein TadG